ncbi:hypothetical protein J6590_068801 [Homalodisca vitripennis]|nr:hypothetical protein J6590_068801 [Homalodisca vitripennis]
MPHGHDLPARLSINVVNLNRCIVRNATWGSGQGLQPHWKGIFTAHGMPESLMESACRAWTGITQSLLHFHPPSLRVISHGTDHHLADVLRTHVPSTITICQQPSASFSEPVKTPSYTTEKTTN